MAKKTARTKEDDARAALFELGAELARRCLGAGFKGSRAEAGKALCEACVRMGHAAVDAEEAERVFMRALVLALLSEANAVYTYPYSERELASGLLPVWLSLLRDLTQPGDLRQAFLRYYGDFEDFPVPRIILDYLSQRAFARTKVWQAEWSGADPALRRGLAEKLREQCRVLKFQRLAHE